MLDKARARQVVQRVRVFDDTPELSKVLRSSHGNPGTYYARECAESLDVLYAELKEAAAVLKQALKGAK